MSHILTAQGRTLHVTQDRMEVALGTCTWEQNESAGAIGEADFIVTGGWGTPVSMGECDY